MNPSRLWHIRTCIFQSIASQENIKLSIVRRIARGELESNIHHPVVQRVIGHLQKAGLYKTQDDPKQTSSS